MAVHANSTPAPGPRLLRGAAAPGRLLTTEELIALLGSRENIEATVEGLIAVLDEDEGDSDLEPTLGSPEAWPYLPAGTIDQSFWAQGSTAAALDEAEAENEHGEEREAEARELRRAAVARRATLLPIKAGVLLQFRHRVQPALRL